MKKILFAIAFIACLGFTEARAQQYEKAAGISLSPAMGINGKFFFAPQHAVEAGIAYHLIADAPMISAVYQYHLSLVDNLSLYAGGGINIGAIHTGRYQHAKFALGIDPTVGFEYVFQQAPIALAIDYRPEINLTCRSIWNMAAFKIRYIF